MRFYQSLHIICAAAIRTRCRAGFMQGPVIAYPRISEHQSLERITSKDQLSFYLSNFCKSLPSNSLADPRRCRPRRNVIPLQRCWRFLITGPASPISSSMSPSFLFRPLSFHPRRASLSTFCSQQQLYLEGSHTRPRDQVRSVLFVVLKYF